MQGNLSQLLHFFAFIAIVRGTTACKDVEIVGRAKWGSRFPSHVVPIPRPVQHLFIGHTVTPLCNTMQECSAQMRGMQNFHMDKLKWSDIGYNFVIGGDGRVYEGVGWTREGVHTYGWNKKSYGIAFVGDFTAVQPNHNMLKAARKLIVCGIKMGFIAEDRLLHGARDGTCTASPGDALYETIKKWPRFQEGPLEGYKC